MGRKSTAQKAREKRQAQYRSASAALRERRRAEGRTELRAWVTEDERRAMLWAQKNAKHLLTIVSDLKTK